MTWLAPYARLPAPDPLAVTVAVVPVFLLLLAASGHGRHRTTSPALWASFLLGALVVVPVGALGVQLAGLAPPVERIYMNATFHSFVNAGLLEESAKLAMLVVIAACFAPRPKDWIVLATAMGLGFAAAENVIYAAAIDRFDVLAIRSITAIPAHAAIGTLMGTMALLAAGRGVARASLVLLVPAVSHGLYDLPLHVVNGIVTNEHELTTEIILFNGGLFAVVFAALVVFAATGLDVARRNAVAPPIRPRPVGQQ